MVIDNKIPDGYKLTEVGVIPRDWEVKKLSEIFTITAGGDLRKDAFSEIKDEKYPYPIYSNSLSNHGLYGFSSSYEYDEHCVTVTARGTIGAANPRNHKFNAIGRVLVLVPSTQLDCFFISEYINNRVRFSIESTGVPQLTAPQVAKYLVAYPEPKEQTSIAAALSDVDNLITSLNKIINKKINIKQGTMQELLTGKKRLQGFSRTKEEEKDRFYESVPVSSVASIHGGGTPKRNNPRYWGGSIKWVSAADVSSCESRYITSTSEHISELGLRESSANLLGKDTLVITARGTVGKICMLSEPMTFNQTCYGLVAGSNIDSTFLFFALKQSLSVIKRQAYGAVFDTITKNSFDAIHIPLPSIPEQTAIAQILNDMDTEINQLEQRRDKYTSIKQGMMQQLLTGKIRLI